ncbi:MAG: AgmX/PglI C-terminal domain-containing protein [Silvanigrellales bacterium]|nr:AgmX/PglI C-terminal domain-containing protein [Silvanigrellales bacterium]
MVSTPQNRVVSVLASRSGTHRRPRRLLFMSLLWSVAACQSRPPPVVDTASRPGETAPLTNEEIEAVIASRLGEMKTCFAGLLVEAHGPRGVLTLRWVVQGDGEVDDIETVHTDFEPAQTSQLERCLEPLVSKLPFPRTRGARALRITYPFVVK